MDNSDLKKIAEKSNSWPFVEARNLRDRLVKSNIDNQKVVLFETGYGPSGLPHIGTFGEVARTSVVQHAFQVLTGRQTKLICFSDDMDGLRKVPENVPQQTLLEKYINHPLTSVPDPLKSLIVLVLTIMPNYKAFLIIIVLNTSLFQQLIVTKMVNLIMH